MGMDRIRPRVIVIGAGMGGIGTGVRLKRAGIDDFLIVDRAPRPGGTWEVSRYPGAEVDTDSNVYRFSFAPRAWSRSHAQRAEILDYLDDVIRDHGLEPHLRCGETVREVRWDDATSQYEVVTDAATHRADVVVSAVGLFSEPKIPDWALTGNFEGEVFHTAEWRDDVDLRGKRVAVVGTGSSGAQVVPALAGVADRVYVYQREPGWVMPKPVTEYDEAARRKASGRLRQSLSRFKALRQVLRLIEDGDVARAGSQSNQMLQQAALGHLDTVFADRPDLKAAFTPPYPFMGKRPVLSSEYLPSFLRDDVELVPSRVEKLTSAGIVDASGGEREVDVIVLATGFKAADFLCGLPVRGRGGVALADVWGQDPQALLGLTVPDFPNFFMLYGPNTNGAGSILWMQEMQARQIVWALRRMRRSGARVVDTKRWVSRAFNAWLDAQWQDSVFFTSRNYYTSPTGRIVTNWPRSMLVYWAMLAAARWGSYEFSTEDRARNVVR